MTDKDQILRDFNKAFSKNDTDFILKSLSDDVVWTMVGDKTMKGKEEVRIALKEMDGVEALEMQIDHVVTNGSTAAVDGYMEIRKPSGEISSFGFCDIYEFSKNDNSLINIMTSYVLPLRNREKPTV